MKKYEKATEVFENIGKDEHTRQPMTKQFEIKIYPCDSHSKENIITTLSEKLADQIKLDQKLRVCREKFGAIEGDEKWKNLKVLLSR